MILNPSNTICSDSSKHDVEQFYIMIIDYCDEKFWYQNSNFQSNIPFLHEIREKLIKMLIDPKFLIIISKVLNIKI